MPAPIAYLNGKHLPLKKAHVGILDLGLLRGFGIYEGITAIDGEPFHFHDHWARFARSAKALGLKLPTSEKKTLAAMRKVIQHNVGKERATVRMLLLGGEGEYGIKHKPGNETFFIAAEKAMPPPAEWYATGASLFTHPHMRFMPEYKTVHYISAVLLQPRLKKERAVEALYTDGSRILECTGSNIFIVKDGTLVTPERDILHGITRKVVLKLAKGSYPIEARDVTLDELMGADEVFITSSFKDIVPIVRVDGKAAGGSAPGPITRDLMARFKKHAGV